MQPESWVIEETNRHDSSVDSNGLSLIIEGGSNPQDALTIFFLGLTQSKNEEL